MDVSAEAKREEKTVTNDETETRTPFLELERAEWRFLLKWVLASAVGAAVGAAVSGGVGLILNWARVQVIDGVLGWALLGAMVGAGVGTAQRIVLRHKVQRFGGWVLASAAGWAIGAAVGFVVIWEFMDNPVNIALGLVQVGAVVGIAQWTVLLQRVRRSGWWVLASALAWIVSLVTIVAGLGGAGGLVGGLAVGFAVDGALTGFVLIKLLRRPIPAVRVLSQ
jgi:hypothetical protein